MSETRATFRSMAEGTAEDWAIIDARHKETSGELADRTLDHLRLLAGDSPFAVDRLTHSLQTTARAERAGRGDDYLFCALMHDIGDILGPFNHQDIAAAVVRPFVSDELHFMVAHHAEFQGYYFWHYLGRDRDQRELYRDHPSYDLTVEFCAEFDQSAFDPDYPTPPLEHYEALVRDVMAKPRHAVYAKRA